MIKIVLGVLALSFTCLAGDWSSLYDSARLETEKPRLATALNVVVQREITPFVPDQQATAFGLLDYDLPLTGFRSNPLDYYSDSAKLVLPVRTLLFVEDLSRAYGWMWANRYSTRTVDEYLSMLRYRSAESFSDKRYPAPLAALHVPADALADQRVVKASVQIRRTAFSFIILHQFAHMQLQHQPKGRHEYSEAQEEEADRFALEILKKNSNAPTGILVAVYGGLFLEGSEPGTIHPVTAHRLIAMAQFLEGRVTEFVEGRPDRKAASDGIFNIAKMLVQAADFLSIRGHQEELQQLAMRTDPGSLLPQQLPRSTR